MDADKKLIVEMIDEERIFLHDIASPLMVIRLTLENLEAEGHISEGMREKFARAMTSVVSLSEKVEQRRTHIKSRRKESL